jgi:hypothetical protein
MFFRPTRNEFIQTVNIPCFVVQLEFYGVDHRRSVNPEELDFQVDFFIRKTFKRFGFWHWSTGNLDVGVFQGLV